MNSIIAIDQTSHTCDKNDNAPGQGGIEGYRSNHYVADYTSNSALPCDRHHLLPALLRVGPRPIAVGQGDSGEHQPRRIATQLSPTASNTAHLNGSSRCALTSKPQAGSPLMKEVSSC
jgi:hypothetical protein